MILMYLVAVDSEKLDLHLIRIESLAREVYGLFSESSRYQFNIADWSVLEMFVNYYLSLILHVKVSYRLVRERRHTLQVSMISVMEPFSELFI
jgi:hypothetical protein